MDTVPITLTATPEQILIRRIINGYCTYYPHCNA